MDQKTIDELEAKRQRALAMGTPERIARLHEQGKLTARERLDLLLDPGSFREIGLHAQSQLPELRDRTPADGMIVGSGRIEGRLVYVTADDATVLAGTRGRVAELKGARAREMALRDRAPYIALMEAGAARVQETYGAIAAGLGNRFASHYGLSGRIPQVAAVMGATFGGPSFTALQSDFVPIVEGSGFLGMSGPPVVKVGIGLDVTSEELGGGKISTQETGQAHYLAPNEADCLATIRRFLSFMPSSCWEAPPHVPPRPAPCDSEEGLRELVALVPENHRRAYDMLRLIQLLVDGGDFFQVQQEFGRSLIVGFARIEGQTVGVIANQPMRLAGTIDPKSVRKARRFVDLCDAFHIPLVSLMDCPGFLVGPDVERQSMVSLTTRMLTSMIQANVPIVTIVIRKAIGLAYIALGGRAVGPDTLVAWPTARFDVMGPDAGIELIHGKAIREAADPAALRAEIARKFELESSAYVAAGLGHIDDVIAPTETRRVIVDTLARRRGKQELGWKHRIDP